MSKKSVWVNTVAASLLVLDTSLPLQAGGVRVATEADARHQPSLDTTRNGIPLVNIVSPNSTGISHNKFSEFSVDPAGLILNNARQSTSTELGGYVYGNENLSQGAARLILNEVTSTARSHLEGYTEVAGQGADVVLANPNGITINGGGFINVPTVTLTTGMPVFDGAQLRGFEVQAGNILLEGAGLNATNLDKVSFYTKTLQLNAALRGKDIDVVTGENFVTRDGRWEDRGGVGERDFSIDSSALGGIYADRIRLIGTDAGVGVNLPQLTYAQDQLILRADGRIVLGDAVSEGGIDIYSRTGPIEITNKIYGEEVALKTTQSITTGALNLAARRLVIDAGELNNAGIVAAGFDKDLAPVAGGLLEISADNLSNSGSLFASQQALIDADLLVNEAAGTIGAAQLDIRSQDRLDNQGEVAADTLTINAGELNNSAQLTAYDRVQLTTSDTLSNTGDIQARNHARLDAAQLDNQAIVTVSDGDLDIHASALNNAAGAVIGSGRDTTIEGERLINTGRISAAQDLALSVDEITNQGALTSGRNLRAQADTLVNEQMIFSANAMDLRASSLLHNRAGAGIYANADIALAVTNLEGSAVLLNESATVEAGGDMTIQADTVRNTVSAYEIGTTESRREVIEYTDVDFGDFTVKVRTGKDVTTETAEYIKSKSDPAKLIAHGDLGIDARSVENMLSLIAANENIVVHADALDNRGRALKTTTQNTHYLWRCVSDCGSILHKADYAWVDPVSTSDAVITGYAFGTIQAGGDITANVDLLDNGEITPRTGAFTTAMVTAETAAPAGSAPFGAIAGAADAIKIPTGDYGLFIRTSDPSHPYLIETNPLFTLYQEFIGSDYLLEKLDYAPERSLQRLGDDHYETRLVSDAILSLTGRRYLNGFGSDLAQYQALMDNALTAAAALDLGVGVSLAPEQVAALTQDIVWLEERLVEGRRVLVPVVYLATLRADHLPAGGAIIQAGGDLTITASGAIENAGAMTAGQAVNISAETLRNQGGAISAGADLSLHARGDITNASGALRGDNVRIESTAGSFINERLSHRIELQHAGGVETLTALSDQASVTADSQLSIRTGTDIVNRGGALRAGGDIALAAEGGDIVLDTVMQSHTRDYAQHGGHLKEDTTRQHRATLEAGGTITATAGRDIAINAARLSADQDITLQAAGDIDITAALERDYHDEKITQKGDLGSAKTTHHMSDRERVVSTEFAAQNLTLHAGNDMLLESANAEVAGSTTLTAQNDLTISAKAYREAELHYTQRRGALGLSGSESMAASQSTQLAGSLLSAAGNITADTGRDLRINASTVRAAGDIAISAGNAVHLEAGLETAQQEQWHRDRGFLEGGELFQEEFALNGQTDQTARGTLLAAGGKVNVAAERIRVAGSDIEAAGALVLEARSGDIALDAIEETHTRYSEERTITIGFGDTLEALASPTAAVEIEDGRAALTLADAAYDAAQERTATTTQRVATLNSGGDMALTAAEDIVLIGAQLSAAGDATLQAEGEVIVQEAIESQQQASKETHGTAEVSVGLKHQAVEVVLSAQALDASREKLKQAKDAYEDYQAQLESQADELAALTVRYHNREPGITYADVQEFQQLVDDLRGDEKYFLMDLTAAAADVTSKTTLLVQQIATSAQSASTWGFNADMQLDIDAVVSQARSYVLQSKASQIQAGNDLTITSGGDTTVRGSNLLAGNGLDIRAQDLHLLASVDTFEGSRSQDHAHGNVTLSVHGAAAGPQVSLAVDTTRGRERESRVNNSRLAATDIHITTRENATVAGANVDAADTLRMDIGHNLILASQQETASGKSHTLGLSAGGSANSANGGVSSANGSHASHQTVLTRLTGETVDIDVGGHTDLTGALIAAVDAQGRDNGQLSLSTQTLSVQDLRDTASSRQRSMGLSTSVGLHDAPATEDAGGERLSVNSSNFNYANSSHIEAGKTLATIGQGSLTVRDEVNAAGLTLLNRDIQATDLDLYALDRQQGNVDMTLDHRLLSEEGRAEIAQEMRDSGKNIQIIAQNVPGEAGGNVIENAAGKLLNLLNTATLGVTPSADSHGGVIAQIPILLGADDISQRNIRVAHQEHDYVKQHPDEFVSIENLPGYHDLSTEQQRVYQGLVVSKDDYQINARNATYQNPTNGMMNSPALAVINGLEQSFNQMGTDVNFTQNYNPTHGFLGDLFESGVDTLSSVTGNYFETGIAQQTGEFILDVTTARGSAGSNFPAHSQGNLLLNSGLNYIGAEGFSGIDFVGENGQNNQNKLRGIPSFASYGSPVNVETMEDTLREMEFVYIGAVTHKNDAVGERLGGNVGVNGQRDVASRLLDPVSPATYLDAIRLFTEDSPHSSYKCSELRGARCGDRP